MKRMSDPPGFVWLHPYVERRVAGSTRRGDFRPAWHGRRRSAGVLPSGDPRCDRVGISLGSQPRAFGVSSTAETKRSCAAMFLTRKHLSRRTVLKGAGATIALPLLDAMIPAGTALAATAAAPATRLGFIYFPHGALQDEWQPKTIGRNPDFPVILKPLDA